MRKPKQNSQQKRLRFKFRGVFSKQQTKLLYGVYGLYCYQQSRIEGIYVKKLKLKYRKSFKRLKRQHRPQTTKKLLWVRYKLNIDLTRKSKNARMGSGKGKLSRKACRVKPQQTVLEFRKVHPTRVKVLQRHLKRKWAIQTYFIKKNSEYQN